MLHKKIAIIGAGITGLSTAYQLRKNGIQPDVFERKSQPGGVIQTCRNDGWLYEYGPNTLLLKEKVVENFLKDLDLINDIEVANPKASKRFIVKNNRLEPLPSSFMDFIKTPLFSSRAKWRLLSEPFAGKSSSDLSLADFIKHRFGKEILDYAVNPFVAGIYAGNPENLSLRHSFPLLAELEQDTGSVFLSGIKRMFSKKSREGKVNRKLVSLKDGLHKLPLTIADQLEQCYFEQEIKRVEKSSEGWHLFTPKQKYGPYQKVVFTVPLYRWQKDLIPIHDDELERINEVYYPPLSVMVLGFEKNQVSHPLDGFGLLVPEAENRTILGALMTSTLFEGRTPPDHHLLTVFIGGGRQPELAKKESNELLQSVKKDLAELIGLREDPVFKEHIYWPKSIPQYEPGYGSILNIFDAIEERNPGFYIAGNFRGGISVPDCIKKGIELANRLS